MEPVGERLPVRASASRSSPSPHLRSMTSHRTAVRRCVSMDPCACRSVNARDARNARPRGRARPVGGDGDREDGTGPAVRTPRAAPVRNSRHPGRADPRAADYTRVIRRASGPARRMSAYTRAMGRALVLNVTDLPLAVRAREAGRRARPQGEGRGGRLQRRDLPERADRASRRRPSSGCAHFVHVPFRHARAADAPGRVRARRVGLPVLRRGRREPRPRAAAVARRPARVGERRGRVPALQRQEDGPHARRRPASISHRQPFAPSDGFRLTLGPVEPGWEPYLL